MLSEPLAQAIGGVSGVPDKLLFKCPDLPRDAPLPASLEPHRRQGRERFGRGAQALSESLHACPAYKLSE